MVINGTKEIRGLTPKQLERFQKAFEKATKEEREEACKQIRT
jgi:ABC-type transporter MlaC component